MRIRHSFMEGIEACSTERFARRNGRERGSVLIIVLWVMFGLVSITLYFAHSMSFELRAADNRVAATEADQAIAGAARYVSNILATAQQSGALPDTNAYRFAAVPVGESTFWLIGRGDGQDAPATGHFGLVDEASKLNVNSATTNMLLTLPRMTPELAANIISWRSSANSNPSGGAESDTYLRLNPPYLCKNAAFESVDELRLVSGAYLDVLYGEDANLNGVLDPNENDGELSPPSDDQNGRLDPGILEYLTVFTHEPATTTNGTARVAVTNVTQLGTLLRSSGLNVPPGGTYGSVLEFYYQSRLSVEDFAKVEDQIRNPNLDGLVNVNTASAVVLAGLFNGVGVDTNNAVSLVAYRQSQAGPLTSIAWVKNVLDLPTARRVGPYLTGRTYQFTADVAAVGHYGRGYRRVKYVFDTSDGAPKIVYRQDLTHMGWALGQQARDTLLAVKALR
jgi:type II secretory pathway component PulK